MKILAIFGHPNHNLSKVNKSWFNFCQGNQVINSHYLSEEYPNLEIDVEKEQKLLMEHDRVVLIFPMYWYSCPAVMKLWMDSVLQPGFAYGRGGDKLKGKELMICTSIGSSEEDYRAGGFNNFTVDEFFKPLQQTASYIGMSYLPAYVFFESMICSEFDIEKSSIKLIEKIKTNYKKNNKRHDILVDKSTEEFMRRLIKV
tara:strand:+ start:2766 stop:3365 length:600 start_codon:yes stop_codon:yes gene_type:complete